MARDSSRSSRGDSSRGSKRTYEYKSRDSESYKKRGEQSSSTFDTYIKDSVKMYKVRDGDNAIRILPPTWEDAEHYGIDVWVHYNVGADNQSYVCLDKHKGEPCPICEAREEAAAQGDTDTADALKPSKRVAVWMIDRLEEKEGPQLWAMPWTMDRDICKIVVDKRTGEVLPIDHPYEGYDIEFEKKGKAMRTEYLAVSIARRPSDLGNDDWLDFVQDNPLPEQLNFYEYDHIDKVVRGTKSSKSDSSDRGSRSKSSKSKSKELDWDEIHDMGFDDLVELVEKEGLNIDVDSAANDLDLADWVCDELRIKKPSKKSSRDDEDEKPAKRSSRRTTVDEDEDEPAPRKSSRKVVEDDEDEDEKPAKRSSRKVVEEEDEDEAPVRKSSRKAVVDDEDDEEPPVRRRKRD